MTCADTSFLWKEYFTYPAHFWDNRNNKKSPRSPDFKHKHTKEALWVHDLRNPPWVQEELRRADAEPSAQWALQDFEASEDSFTLVGIINTCAKQKDLERGILIHDSIRRRGLLGKNVYVDTALLHMYAKCGALESAQEVFDDLSVRDVVSWNALITGYSQNGQGAKALDCFRRMQDEGFSPTTVTFMCILKACGSIGAVEKGEEIHAETVSHGLLQKNILLGTALVDMYAKCGAFAEAWKVFNELPQNVVCWNVLISGYAQNGHGHEALNFFACMQDEGFSPNAVTFLCALKACGSIRAKHRGMDIHMEVSSKGLLGKNMVLGTALVDMYAKCGALGKAQEVFDELPKRDAVTWSALISGYAENGHEHEAVDCFKAMLNENLFPDVVTFACILKACSSRDAVDEGEALHAEVNRRGLLENNLVLGNILVDMYVKFGMLEKAEMVFNKLLFRNTISWNAIIAGYARYGPGEKALYSFQQMQDEGLIPNSVTFICVFTACANIGAAEKCEKLHMEADRHGLEKDVILGTALVDMYVKCGLLERAQEAFDELPMLDIVSWNALIAGYVQYGHDIEALDCYKLLQDGGFSPNIVTFIFILKTCSNIGAVAKGEQVHAELNRQGLLENNVVLVSALVDMYAKLGMITKAKEAFDKLPLQDVVPWNALIAGHAQVGDIEQAFNWWHKLVAHTEPNLVTFLILLTVCSHVGLMDEGQMLFETMGTLYCFLPTLEHHTCMIDLFGRAGHLDNARCMIAVISLFDCFSYWLVLLGACQKWLYMELGKWAFQQAIHVKETHASAYVCMGNLYAAAAL